MEAPEASESIPYRIEVEDGPVVRCWEPRDAELLKDAVDVVGTEAWDASRDAG